MGEQQAVIETGTGRWSELRPIWALAWPSVLAMFGFMGLAATDVVMVGRFGEVALGGISLAQGYVVALMVFSRGVLRSAEPRLSQAWGAQDLPAFQKAYRAALMGGLLLAVPVMLLHLPAAPVLTLLQQPAEIVPLAGSWCAVLALAVPAQMWFSVQLQALTASGAVRTIPVVVAGANLLNIGLNLVLMYGVGAWEGLGPIGAAWSTLTVELAMPLMLWVLARKRLAESWPGWDGLNLKEILEILRSGLPVGLQQGLEVWGWVITSLLMGWLGTGALAGHTITINLASISFMLPLGIASAASARVGNLIGAGLPWNKAAWTAVGLGVAGMSVSAMAFAFIPETLARIYTDDADAIAAACLLLPIAAAFQLFDGAQGVGFGVLRGAGDLRYGSAVNVVGYYCVGLPLGALLAFEFGFGPSGVWIGLSAALAVIAGLLLRRVMILLRRSAGTPSARAGV